MLVASNFGFKVEKENAEKDRITRMAYIKSKL